MTHRDEILAEVAAERERQIAKGYGLEHDRTHGTGHIIGQIDERVTAWRVGSSPRSELIQIAALAVAAVEVADEDPFRVANEAAVLRSNLADHA